MYCKCHFFPWSAYKKATCPNIYFRLAYILFKTSKEFCITMPQQVLITIDIVCG